MATRSCSSAICISKRRRNALLGRACAHSRIRLFLAGIDDAHYFRGDNIEKAAAGIPNEGFSILLSHTPEIYRQAAHAGFDLLLSGHTLGGQICLLGGTNPARFGSTSLYGIRRLNLSQHGRLHVRRCRIVCRCRVDQLEPGGQSSKSGARRTAERSSTRLYTQAADGVASEGASSFFCSPDSCAATSARKRDMIVEVHSWISTSV
jgi:hypothetical protein